MIYQCKDKVKSKKAHVCGGKEWEVLRTGADYKLKCCKCGHIILVDYNKLIKMIEM